MSDILWKEEPPIWARGQPTGGRFEASAAVFLSVLENEAWPQLFEFKQNFSPDLKPTK
jgi:hypothetical protein